MATFLWIFGIGLILLLVFNEKLRARALNLVRRYVPIKNSATVLEVPMAVQQTQDIIEEEVPDGFWWRGKEIRKTQFNEWPQYFSYRNLPDYFGRMLEIHKDKAFWNLMQIQEQLYRSEKFYMARWLTFKKAQDEK